MPDYEVIYRININALTPQLAAIEIESYLKHSFYRPAFEITNTETGEKTLIDLDTHSSEQR